MKQSILFFAAILLFAACKPKDKAANTGTNAVTNMAGGDVTISGTITGLDSGYVELIHEELEGSKIDSVVFTNSKFLFTTKLKEPTQYALRIAGADKVEPLIFFADPGLVNITGAIDSLNKAVVKAGPTHDEYVIVNTSLNNIFKKADPYFQQFGDAREKGDEATITRIQKFFDSLTTEANSYIVNYATAHKSSLVSATLLNANMGDASRAEATSKIFDGFAGPIKNSIPGRKLKLALDAIKSTSVGATATNFTQNDVNGKPVSLASFKGKYVLLDFWASWCAPCRAENPNIVKAYNAYNLKGFDILGVSLDENKTAWLAAIKKDKLTWTHVCDFKGFNNEAANLYRINAIPANFLLDKEGKIIAVNLTGPALESKLKELMP